MRQETRAVTYNFSAEDIKHINVTAGKINDPVELRTLIFYGQSNREQRRQSRASIPLQPCPEGWREMVDTLHEGPRTELLALLNAGTFLGLATAGDIRHATVATLLQNPTFSIKEGRLKRLLDIFTPPTNT